MNPKARDNSLLVHQVEDEIVVYDRTQKRAHRLNVAVAKVWSLLDGERSVNEIAGELEVDESVVALAVDDLANAQLLESSEPLSVSRRSALGRVASAPCHSARTYGFDPLALQDRSTAMNVTADLPVRDTSPDEIESRPDSQGIAGPDAASAGLLARTRT